MIRDMLMKCIVYKSIYTLYNLQYITITIIYYNN